MLLALGNAFCPSRIDPVHHFRNVAASVRVIEIANKRVRRGLVNDRYRRDVSMALDDLANVIQAMILMPVSLAQVARSLYLRACTRATQSISPRDLPK